MIRGRIGLVLDFEGKGNFRNENGSGDPFLTECWPGNYLAWERENWVK